MSRFTDELYANALSSSKGMVTGEPDTPVRHTWKQVHERAKQVAGGLARAGLGPDDAIGMLVGMPVEIAPAIQAVWMRGASLTMLHQPTPRTDLAVWAEDTLKVVDMIGAKAVIVSAPFDAAAPVLEEKGVIVVHIKDLWDADPIEPLEADEDSVALMQLTSGSTGSPKAVKITHRNLYANAHGMYVASKYKPEIDVMVSWLPLFHDMGMVGFLTVPMFFGAELVKITPMDFMRDVLLWGRLIDKYKGTMTAAPNFAYSLFAKRLRNQAKVTSTSRRCGSCFPVPSPWTPPWSKTYVMPESRSASSLLRWCPPTAWRKPRWPCPSRRSRPPVWSSTRSTPICWPPCGVPFPPPAAICAIWPRWAPCCPVSRRGLSTRT